MRIPEKLTFNDIMSTYNDIKERSIIPYRIKFGLIVEVPIFSRLTLPLEKTGEISVHISQTSMLIRSSLRSSRLKKL